MGSLLAEAAGLDTLVGRPLIEVGNSLASYSCLFAKLIWDEPTDDFFLLPVLFCASSFYSFALGADTLARVKLVDWRAGWLAAG